MKHFTTLLQELDRLFHAGDFDQCEQYWLIGCHHAQHFFPGFTIAYAELHTSGSHRVADGSMHHVLVAQPQEL